MLLAVSGALAQTGTPLVTLTNTTWRYDDSGTDRGTAWRGVSYPSENSWPTGRGLFGVESTAPYPYPEPIRTPLVLNARRTTYYFRTHFNFAGNPAGLILRATAYVDDGAVFYLNGVELRRVRLPDGPIAFTNKAQLAWPEGVPVTFDFEATGLGQGDNVLAVEVHQHSDTSTDVVFGFALNVVSSQAPAILNPSEPADRTVPEGDTTTLSVFVSGFPPPAYQWFKNDASIPGAVEPDLVLPNVSGTDVGNYFCRATNSAGGVTSRTAAVTFIKDTNGPVILYAVGDKDNLNLVHVLFSEPPNEAEATDNFNWEIPGLNIVSASLTSPTNLTITTQEPREANVSYLLRRIIGDLHELVDHGNPLPVGTEAPIALFESILISNNDPHVWRYDHSDFDPGPDWARPAYNDTGWQTGAGAFDAMLSDDFTNCNAMLQGIMFEPVPVRTCLALSYPSNGEHVPTIYFRTHFAFTGDNTNSILRLQTAVNDGAVFYLNGIEIFRLRMPEGPITHDTLAISAVDNTGFQQFDADAPGLVVGDNVLAVELHQTAPNVTDFVTFGLQLLAVAPDKPLERPVLNFQMVGANLELTWTPADGILESTDDPSGSWSPVTESYPPGQYVTSAAEAKRFYRVAMP